MISLKLFCACVESSKSLIKWKKIHFHFYKMWPEGGAWRVRIEFHTRGAPSGLDTRYIVTRRHCSSSANLYFDRTNEVSSLVSVAWDTTDLCGWGGNKSKIKIIHFLTQPALYVHSYRHITQSAFVHFKVRRAWVMSVWIVTLCLRYSGRPKYDN